MEDNAIESPVTGRDPEWKNKQNNHCVINIFCGEKTCDWDSKDSGNCVINIFCGEKKPDEHCTDKKSGCKW